MADTGGARGNGDALPRTLSDQSVAWRSSAAQVHPEHVDIGDARTHVVVVAEAPLQPKLCGIRLQVFAYMLFEVVAFQYLFSVLTVALLSQIPTRKQEPRPWAHGYADKSVTLVALMLCVGFALFALRVLLLGVIAMKRRATVDSHTAENSWVELAVTISRQLSFIGLSGAPIYFIESMCLRIAWDHSLRFSISCILLGLASMEISLSCVLLLWYNPVSAPPEEPAAGATLFKPRIERPPIKVEHLLCKCREQQEASEAHSCASCGTLESPVRTEADKQESSTRGGKLKPLYIDDLEVLCAICLMPLVAGDVAGSLPCKHLFHSDCVARWLESGHACPMRCEAPPPS
mmetsp:Transcript_6076/g.14535  ORF Transcript_6076/g.14535 Transcript_6076/m.14535 type:complete len:347 (-) Transcript_6076:138-1178(-)